MRGIVGIPKVYCIDCKNFYFGFIGGKGCRKVKMIVDTPLTRKKIYYNYEKQNKNNNCKYYIKKRHEVKEVTKKKWYKFWN